MWIVGLFQRPPQILQQDYELFHIGAHRWAEYYALSHILKTPIKTFFTSQESFGSQAEPKLMLKYEDCKNILKYWGFNEIIFNDDNKISFWGKVAEDGQAIIAKVSYDTFSYMFSSPFVFPAGEHLSKETLFVSYVIFYSSLASQNVIGVMAKQLEKTALPFTRNPAPLKSIIYSIGQNKLGFLMQSEELISPTIVSLNKAYSPVNLVHKGEEFMGIPVEKVYKYLFEKLKTESKGALLLRSVPGVGKTKLLQRLLSELSLEEKIAIIHLTKSSLEILKDPMFHSFFAQWAKSWNKVIFYIPDAESLLDAKELQKNDRGMILNLIDGVEQQAFKCLWVIDYNGNVDTIDPAILRPGRLLNMIELEPLSVEQAEQFLSDFSYNKEAFTKWKAISDIKARLTLAEIYEFFINSNPEKGEDKLRKILTE